MSAPSAALRAKAAVNYAESSDSDSDRDGRAAAAPAKRVRKAPAAPRARRVSLPPPTDAATAAREAGLQPGAAATRLLEITLNHPDTVDAAVSDWADAYEARRGAATAELLSLLVQAAGADASVAAADVDEGDTDDLVARLVAAVTAGGVADPYARGGRAGVRARAAYGSLWRGAIGALAARGLLGDGYFVDKATAVLLGLSSSIVRPFRLLATQTAGDVGTALVTAALSLGAAREAATAQRDAELAKGTDANRDTVAQLQRQADDAHRAAGDARAALDALYTGIATARFRDVCPDVRAAVVAAVGAWIRLDPAAYLSEHYLKYVAWAMSDRDARVRSRAVDALRALYADPALHSALRSFTERFTSRFVELVHDVDDGVAGKGVDLVGALVRAGELPADDAGDVFRLLTEPAPAVRAAAADLVAGLLASEVEKKAAEVGGAIASPAAAGRRGRRGRAAGAEPTASTVASQPADTSTLAVDALLDVLARLAAPPAPRGGADDDDDDVAPPATTTSTTAPLPATTVDVVVASLADRVPVLTDFGALVGALSEDAAEARGEPGTTNAVLLLAAAVKAAAGHETGKRRRGAGARSTSPLAAATAALAPALGALLTRFGADAAKVAPLVATLAWLDLAPLAAARDGGGLAALLRKVADLAARHADAGAVRACARALARCAESGPGSARGAARDVLDGAFVAAAAAVGGGGGGGGGGRVRGRDASTPTAPAWRRAASLCLVAAPPQNASESIVESAQRVLGTAATGADVDTEAVASAAAAGLACLLWRLTDAANAAASVTSPARTRAAAAVGGAAGDYAAALADAVSGARAAGGRAAAAAALSDLLLAFSAKGLAATPAAAAAAYDAPPAVAQALLRYADAAIAGADAAAPAPGAPDKSPAEAAALMLARLLAYGVVGPASDAAYVLLSHVAADDAAAATAARDGVRAAKKVDAAAPTAETWAKALGAAAGRGADALDALVGAVLVAPTGSPLDVGGDKAAAVVARAVDAAFAAPGRLAALAPLAGLAAKVRPVDAAAAAAKVRAAADRAARLAGVGVGAEAALHAVADALARRAAAAGGAVRPALRAAGAAAAAGGSDRRISFAGDEGDGLAASDADGDGLTASDGDGVGAAAPPPTRVQLGGSSADRLPTHPVAAADDGDDDESEDEEDVRRAPARV